mgnify:CR=1 FL=1
MENPETIPEKIQEKLKTVGLWDVRVLPEFPGFVENLLDVAFAAGGGNDLSGNLAEPVDFRITWKNEAKETGGLFQKVPNYVEIPSSLSGVPCRIIAMAGKAP